MSKLTPSQLKKSVNNSHLVRIEPDQWLPATFARAGHLIDIIRFPDDDYPALPPAEQNLLRQSQLEPAEVFRVLGYHAQHVLVMKSDQVVGWVLQQDVEVNPALAAFDPMKADRVPAEQFFSTWTGVPYLWGGITVAGTDCSGLTQRYFRDVLNRGIPKNTFDQRRFGTSKGLADLGVEQKTELATHDLLFCTRIGGPGTHHVGIYVDGEVWHANRDRGVIRQSLKQFLTAYQVLEVVDLNTD